MGNLGVNYQLHNDVNKVLASGCYYSGDVIKLYRFRDKKLYITVVVIVVNCLRPSLYECNVFTDNNTLKLVESCVGNGNIRE